MPVQGYVVSLADVVGKSPPFAGMQASLNACSHEINDGDRRPI